MLAQLSERAAGSEERMQDMDRQQQPFDIVMPPTDGILARPDRMKKHCKLIPLHQVHLLECLAAKSKLA